MNDPRVSYEEHLEFLDKQIMGALHEKYGFLDAKQTIAPVLPEDPYLRTRYLQGFNAGQIKLMLEEARTA